MAKNSPQKTPQKFCDLMSKVISSPITLLAWTIQNQLSWRRRKKLGKEARLAQKQ
jgi:hypothetical protein